MPVSSRYIIHICCCIRVHSKLRLSGTGTAQHGHTSRYPSVLCEHFQNLTFPAKCNSNSNSVIVTLSIISYHIMSHSKLFWLIYKVSLYPFELLNYCNIFHNIHVHIVYGKKYIIASGYMSLSLPVGQSAIYIYMDKYKNVLFIGETHINHVFVVVAG